MRTLSNALSLIVALVFALPSQAAGKTGFYAGNHHSYGKRRLSVTQAKRAAAVAAAMQQGIIAKDGKLLDNTLLSQVQQVEVSREVTSRGTVLFKAVVTVADNSPMAKLAQLTAKPGQPKAKPTTTVYGELDINMREPDVARRDDLAHAHSVRRREAQKDGRSDWSYAGRKLRATGHQPSKATQRRAAYKEYKWRMKVAALATDQDRKEADTFRAIDELRLDLESGQRATIFGNSPKRFQQEVKKLSQKKPAKKATPAKTAEQTDVSEKSLEPNPVGRAEQVANFRAIQRAAGQWWRDPAPKGKMVKDWNLWMDLGRALSGRSELGTARHTMRPINSVEGNSPHPAVVVDGGKTYQGWLYVKDGRPYLDSPFLVHGNAEAPSLTGIEHFYPSNSAVFREGQVRTPRDGFPK